MGRRLTLAYLVVFALSAGLAVTSFTFGSRKHAQPKVAGIYDGQADCLGGRGLFRLEQSGQFVHAHGGRNAASFDGRLRLRNPKLTGRVRCVDGSHAELRATRVGGAVPELSGTIGGRTFRAAFLDDLPHAGLVAAPARTPPNEQVFGRLMLAIAAVILAARLFRALIGRVGQPPVMGEVLAGILLGPTLLGAIAPSIQHYLFPSFVIPLLGGAANIGLAFYMFLVGLELDPRLLKGRVAHAAAISNVSVVLPLALGILVALPLYELLAPPGKTFQAFALFMGVAMSITAFPVLARILIERRMLKRPIGALALSSAAVDDVTAWGLLAIASGIAGSGSTLSALPVLGYVLAFVAAMALLARPFLNRLSTAYDEAGQIPTGWIAAIFVGVLLASYASMKAGVAPIFGAFVMGLVMPRRADLSHDVTRRLEDFVATVLLPLFFVVTGLKTDVGLLDDPVLWAIAALLLAVAIAGKWLGAMAIARVAGYRWREAGVLGALMNTRGLTELIVLNIGLELGVISRALFTMLVLMALATTFMAAPAIRLLDPRRELSAPVEEELQDAARDDPPEAPEARATIMVAPLQARNLDELLALAEPLARDDPPWEVLIVQPLEPARTPTSLAAGERDVTRASNELARLRASLAARGIPTRSLAFTSTNRGADVVRLAAEEGAELLLVDGHRPLLGPGIPRGDVGTILAKAPCDVAVLVERERIPPLDAEHPVVVPYGTAEDERGALDLAQRIAAGTDAPLHLVRSEEELLAEAPQAGLVVLALAPNWRKAGLGAARASVTASAPTLLVRPASLTSTA